MKYEYRRRQILESAKKIFARHGYHQTTISMICQKAGIGRGTLYLYFENKEAVFTAILEDLLHKMNEHLESIINQREVQRGKKGLKHKRIFNNKKEFFDAHVEALEQIFLLWMSDRDFTKIAFEMSLGVSKEFTKLRKEFDQQNIVLTKHLLDQWKAYDFVQQDLDTELAAIQLRGAMEKVVTTYFFDQDKSMTRQDMLDLVNKVARMNLYGVFTLPEGE